MWACMMRCGDARDRERDDHAATIRVVDGACKGNPDEKSRVRRHVVAYSDRSKKWYGEDVAQLVKSDLREAIIQVGLQLGTQLGEEGLTMRAIAGRLGVSATALYQCFESKASILRAIRFFGLEQLDRHLAPAFDGPDPIVRLTSVCTRWIEFARENPWLYSVLTDDEELDWSKLSDQEREVLLMPQRRVAQCFSDAIECGRFRRDLDAATAPLALLAAVHGAATLMIKRRISETHPVFPIRNEQHFLSDFIGGVLRGFA